MRERDTAGETEREIDSERHPFGTQVCQFPRGNATSLNSTKSRISNCSIQIQIIPNSQFEFVLQNTEKSEFLDLVDFGGVAISVAAVIPKRKEWETFSRDNVHAREVYDISAEKV